MSASIRIAAALIAGVLGSCSREPQRAGIADASRSTPAPRRATTGSSASVEGSVADADGVRLGRVRVRLRSEGAAWSSPPPDDRRLETVTGPDGVYRFDVPVPTSQRIRLELEPDRFHALATVAVGVNEPADMPRLYPGSNRIPEVRLAAAGAISGRVIAPDGSPVAGASVVAETSTTTRADGTFELDRVVPGQTLVRVSAPELAARSIDVALVEAGAVLALPDVRLDVRGTIAGIVVARESSGARRAPVEGARVEAVDVRSGDALSARTGPDGRFSIRVEENVEHVLRVEGPDGLLAWGGRDAIDVFRPNEADVEVTLDRARAVTFAVVDDVTGAPVPWCAIEVVEDAPHGWSARGTVAPWGDDAAGTVRLDVGTSAATVRASTDREGGRADVLYVPYLPFRGPLALDAQAADRMTIRLDPGGSIRFETPNPAAASARFTARPVVPASEAFAFERAGEPAYEAVALPPPPESSTHGGSGRIGALPPGRYSLGLEVDDQPRRAIRTVDVGPREDVELGTISLEAGGTLRGRVLLQKGASPVGLRVRLDGDFVLAIRSVKGAFMIRGIDPGEHELVLLADPPRTPVERRVKFAIGTGQFRELTFDQRR